MSRLRTGVRFTGDPPGGYVVGSHQFIRRMAEYRQRQAEAVEQGVRQATYMLGELSTYYVPLDTGELLLSQTINFRGHGLETRGSVGYSDPKARSVHENLWWRHGARFNEAYADLIAAGVTHAREPQEQAKFLELPARIYERDLQQVIIDRVAAVRPS